MDIATGLSALNAATKLLGSLMDQLSSNDVKREEVLGRITEIYGHIVESNDAFVGAKNEISELKEKLRALTLYEQRFNVIWRRGDDGEYVGPFCPVCRADGKETPLRHAPGYPNGGDYFFMACNVFHQDARAADFTPVTYRVPKSELPAKW
jgi:hypothetical protein